MRWPVPWSLVLVNRSDDASTFYGDQGLSLTEVFTGQELLEAARGEGA